MLGDCGMRMVSASKYATGVLGAGFLPQLPFWFLRRINFMTFDPFSDVLNPCFHIKKSLFYLKPVRIKVECN
jgi:hypothetical protein